MKGSMRLSASLPYISPVQKPIAVPFAERTSRIKGKPYRDRPEMKMSPRQSRFTESPGRTLHVPEWIISHIGDISASRSAGVRQRLKKRPQNIHVKTVKSEKNIAGFRRKSSECLNSVSVNGSVIACTSCAVNNMTEETGRCPGNKKRHNSIMIIVNQSCLDYNKAYLLNNRR